MPIYEYRCESCSKQFEYMQSISEPRKDTCEACGGPLSKMVSAAAFSFKGGGWYKDLYASPKPGAAAKSDGGPSPGGDKGGDKGGSSGGDKGGSSGGDKGGSSGGDKGGSSGGDKGGSSGGDKGGSSGGDKGGAKARSSSGGGDS